MKKFNTQKMVLNAILLGIGLLLHQIFPAIGGGITPDLLILMLFIIVIINKDDYKACLAAGILTGIFAAITTKFPGGQIPNILDKLVTVNVAYILVKTILIIPIVNKFSEKAKNTILIVILSVIGTAVSGFTFLISAQFIVGLPAGLIPLFVAVVIPTILINTFIGIFLFNIIVASIKRSGFQLSI